MASTYVLDGIARARFNNHIIKGRNETFFNDIKKMYNLKETISALKILSTSTRIFGLYESECGAGRRRSGQRINAAMARHGIIGKSHCRR